MAEVAKLIEEKIEQNNHTLLESMESSAGYFSPAAETILDGKRRNSVERNQKAEVLRAASIQEEGKRRSVQI